MRRQAGLLVALVLAARVGATDDKARSRDGSGSSSHSADVGSRHHSSASSSSSTSGSGQSGSSSSSSSGSTSASDPTPAQRRHPRAGTGTGYAYGDGHYGYGYGYGYGYPYGAFYFGYPAYYYGAWDTGYYGYPAYYGNPYSAATYPPRYPEVGSLRLIVDPVKTRVYVDGYYAGLVDDFDGMFQRLHVSSGRHDVSLKLDGYRTHSFRVYVPVDHTIKLRYDMVRGQGEDPAEVMREPDVAARPAGMARLEDRGDAGRLRVDVRPPDASIYVDAVFRGTARDVDGMPMPPGPHHIEIVRPGYRTLERDIEIRPGESTDLRADLERS